MDEAAVGRALRRISHEIVERNSGVENVLLVGIKRRGVPLAEIISRNIAAIEGREIPVGMLDITFYRDDVTRKTPDPVTESSNLPFDINGKSVILVDDVLYTGRTARAAMEAIIADGRPASVQLAVLIDRGHREFPIRGDYVGKNVPTSKAERVSVKLPPYDPITSVELFG